MTSKGKRGKVADEDGLTVRERKFVDAYVGSANGNATEAMRQTGYDAASDGAMRVAASECLANPNVTRAILVAAKAVSEKTQRQTIADRVEQEEFLTRVLRGEEFDVSATRVDGELVHEVDVVPIEPRLKAADALARRQGLIATKVEQKTELTGKDGTPLLPVAPRTSAEVRAELERLQRIAAETAADVDDIEKGK